MSGQNAYPRCLLVEACQLAVKSVEESKQEMKQRFIEGIKPKTFFGRVKTDEERWKECDTFHRMIVGVLGSTTVEVAKKLLLVCEALDTDDTINVGNDDFEAIADYYKKS